MGVELLSSSKLAELVPYMKAADRRVALCEQIFVARSHDERCTCCVYLCPKFCAGERLTLTFFEPEDCRIRVQKW